MEILNYDPIEKGCLKAKFSIKITEWGNVIIHECYYFRKDANEWIALPSREFEGRDNQKKYFPLVTFPKIVYEKLQMAALAKIKASNFELKDDKAE